MFAHFVEFANDVAAGWTQWAAVTLLSSAALLALVSALWFAIRKKAPPQVGYCLFLLIPLKLLLPLPIHLPASIAMWTPSGAASWLLQGNADMASGNRALPQVRSEIAEVESPTNSSDSAGFEAGQRERPVETATVTGVFATKEATPPPATAISDGTMEQGSSVSAPLSSRLSISAGAMLCWLGVVLLMLARLLLSQWRFQRTLRQAAPVEQSRFPVDLPQLCENCGVTQSVRFVESDDIKSPAVWGMFRPTIILPRGIAASLTTAQLRWALLHELAHVRRRDLLLMAIQRVAAIVNFFNPTVWIANRMADQLREYACDDFAVAKSGSSPIESGEAFLSVLRVASRRGRPMDLALGVFGLDARGSCARRVRRILDADRSVSARFGWRTIAGLLLFAAISLPYVRAGAADNDAKSEPADQGKVATKPETAKPATRDDKPSGQAPKKFELLVVGPDGKAIPEAAVEIRSSPAPTAEQIQIGQFMEKGRYGTSVKSDPSGRLVFTLSTTPTLFNLTIETPGFGPYWAEWSCNPVAKPVPDTFTAQLEAGWSVGGIVVDSEGRPVEGATIRPSIQFRKRPGDQSETGVGAQWKTDPSGKWRIDIVPASKSEVWVEIDHPNHMPYRGQLSRSEYGLELGQEPLRPLALKPGLTVTGKVTDETGKPIAGALLRTKFMNDIRSATTDEKGAYQLVGCESRMAKIVVSAKGKATDMKELLLEPGMAPVDFQMQPGGTIRIKVVDTKGNPIPKTRIFFQKWRGWYDHFEFANVKWYTDDKGVWEWNEAPRDAVWADIWPPGGMDLPKQELRARDAEYVFRPPTALVISGKVVDAATKAPIQAYRAIPGVRSDKPPIDWDLRDAVAGFGGRYQIRPSDSDATHVVRIEADGYRPAVSRDIKSDEGKIDIDFELTKGKNVAATVIAPGGAPAVGAKVALGVADSQINVKNGDIRDQSTYAERRVTDAAGKFHFSPQDSDFQLVITHPSGYAHVKATPDSAPASIQLTAWARVEGAFRVGKQPVAGALLAIDVLALQSHEDGEPSISSSHEVLTGANGEFVFERVVPGEATIGRRIVFMVEDGATEVTSSRMVGANFPAGKTTKVDLGGDGRAVIGKLAPPADFTEKVLWNFVMVSAEINSLKFPMPPEDILLNSAKLKAWLQTDAGKKWQAEYEKYREASVHVSASVDRDGKFRLDDVPPGKYVMNVQSRRQPLATPVIEFIVPEMDAAPAGEAIDLGELTMSTLINRTVPNLQ